MTATRPTSTALLIAALVALCAPGFGHAAAPDSPMAATQLPRSVRPTHYDVAIVPHAKTLRFDGRVTVSIDVLEPTTRITLNAVDLAFKSVRLASNAGRVVARPRTIAVNAAAQTATFSFDRPLPIGGYRLSMAYEGRIGAQAIGFFAIDYATPSGNRRALYTQFENSDARRFMPSWDEPAYKATFALQATVPAAQMAVSNMPIARATALGHGLARVRFAQTPRMSTYLMFFGVGDFDRVATREGATEIAVVTRRGAAPQAAFALESAKAVLAEYNAYFGVPYPLPKLDNIASPGSNQFFGAMENWGAIFTFERGLLLDPSISTVADKADVFETAAHEIAHQWFGDLVTMRWWDDLWLNEGFASWLTARTTERLHPEWNTALSVVSVREEAMTVDALQTTHPVVMHVETAEEANQSFDSITYEKGQSVIGMLEAYVGPDRWREGVRRYIEAHAYGNTVTDDLWRAIDAVADVPITDIAHDFTRQAGIPLLRVDASACVGGQTTLQLGQGEFTADRPAKEPLKWRIPVIAQAIGEPAVRALVTDGRTALTVPGCTPVILNAGQTGYYRTLYAPAPFAAIRDSFAQLAPIDQLGVMDDEWALGIAGLAPTSDALDLISKTPVDADPQIWGDIAQRLSRLDTFYRGDAPRQMKLRGFAIARLSPVFARIGWQASAADTAPQAILRTRLIETLSEFDDAATIDEARRRYTSQSTDPQAVPPALRKSILGVIARHADAATWDELHRAAKAEKTPLIKEQLYRFLSMADDAALATRALELALTDEPGAINSTAMIHAVAARHPDLGFDFAVAHRVQIDALLEATNRDAFYPQLAAQSQDAAMTAKIRAFADAHIAPDGRHAAEAAIANVRYRMAVVADRLPAIGAWLEKNPG